MGQIDRHIIEAFILHEAEENDFMLFESDQALSKRIAELIDNDENWEINNYESFADSLQQCKSHPGFVTPNPAEYYKDNNATTFKQKGLSIGFALVPQPDGNVDIQGVHNNETEVGGIIDDLISAAKRHGGTQLDHFEGKLSDFYSRNGFEEYNRDKWNNDWKPQDWNEERYGTPDVVYRRLSKIAETTNSFHNLMERMNNSKKNLL